MSAQDEQLMSVFIHILNTLPRFRNIHGDDVIPLPKYSDDHYINLVYKDVIRTKCIATRHIRSVHPKIFSHTTDKYEIRTSILPWIPMDANMYDLRKDATSLKDIFDNIPDELQQEQPQISNVCEIVSADDTNEVKYWYVDYNLYELDHVYVISDFSLADMTIKDMYNLLLSIEQNDVIQKFIPLFQSRMNNALDISALDSFVEEYHIYSTQNDDLLKRFMEALHG